MNEFKVGDTICWFEYTKEIVPLCSLSVNRIILVIGKITDVENFYGHHFFRMENGEEVYFEEAYISKTEAIDAMKLRLEEIKNEPI